MEFDSYNLIGLCGVGLGLYAYARVQWQRDYAKRLEFSLVNLGNAACLLISLSKEWNLAAAVSNAIWGGLSLYGIYRCIKFSRKQAATKDQSST